MTNYALKIKTDFTEKDIIKNIQITNCDEAKEYEFTENNFQNILDQNNLQNKIQKKIQENFLSHRVFNLNVMGASLKFIGRYQAEKNLCDISCVVNHNANHTKSNIDIKGVANDEGKIISRSNIFVKKDIKDVEGNENLKFIFVVNKETKNLDQENKEDNTNFNLAEIDAIPSLNINNNQVSINHSLSISKIREEDIWYSELHGSSPEKAKQDFIQSFLL